MADQKKDEKKDFSPLVHQPDELIVQIGSHLERSDKIKLSSTCWRLRLVLGTELFRKIKFTNTEKSGAMMCGLASSKANVLVKKLHFEGRAPTNKSSDYAKIAHMMPCSVHSILSDLSQFPKLEKFTISFDFKLQKEDWDCKLCELFPKLSVEDTLAGESYVGWKALMARTLNAIIPNRVQDSKCTSSGIKNLEIRQLPPILISTYWNTYWRDMLSKVERLRLSIWGGDCGHDKKLLASAGYRLFFKHLDWAITSRLTNLTEFNFSPSVAGMIVGDSMANVLWPDISFPLDASHMRKLKTISFKNAFLTDELIDFLVSHSSTLETVKLTGCYAYEEHPETNVHRVGPSWQKMFVALNESRAPKLRKFEIILSELPNSHLPPAAAAATASGEADASDNTNNANANAGDQTAAAATAAATTNNDNTNPPNNNANANANVNANNNNTTATDADNDDNDDDETKETKRLHRELSTELAAQPGTRCFAYGHLSNNAELVQGWDFVLKHYREGDDLDAYNGLCGLMSANAMETPTRMQRLAARYKSSMAFIHAKPANVGSAAPERYL